MQKVVAHSPMLKSTGCFAHRIVLVAKLNEDNTVNEYVVWTENFNDDGSHRDYFSGSYFPTQSGKQWALNEAFNKFTERSNRHMNYILSGVEVVV